MVEIVHDGPNGHGRKEAPMSSPTPPPAAPMMAPVAPSDSMEVWEITTPGRVWVQVTTATRYGQPSIKSVSVGPNRPGAKLRISTADREMNQEAVAEPKNDPFRNGLLVRTDQPQSANPATASDDALTAQQLLDIFAKQGDSFAAAVEGLSQIPLRRLREMAEAVDATVTQVRVLDELIDERYVRRQSQPDAVFDLSGERHPEGSDGARGSR